jgi:AAA family ATP:ADP antiporter
VFRGFAAQLLIFFVLLRLEVAPVIVAQVFYVWMAVFSLFVVSVFWELMADLWQREQAERLYGFIAAGGTVGALVGPLAAGVLAPRIDPVWLIALTVLGLEFAALCVRRVGRVAALTPGAAAPIGGGLFAGFTLVIASPRLLAIAGYVVLLAITGTFLYLEQMTIVDAVVAGVGERTALFANIDLATNATTLVLQVVVLGRVLPRIGLGWVLAILPIVALAGFAALWVAPVLAVVVVAQVARRAADYAFAKPGREVLFTQVGREAKYKAKSFIDTVAYRGGDAVGAWAYQGAVLLGLGLAGPALLIAPFAGLWIAAGFLLGRRRPESDRRSECEGDDGERRGAQTSAGRSLRWTERIWQTRSTMVSRLAGFWMQPTAPRWPWISISCSIGRPLRMTTGSGRTSPTLAARRTIFMAVSPRMSGRLMSRSRRSG